MTAEGALRIHEFSLHLHLQDRKLNQGRRGIWLWGSKAIWGAGQSSWLMNLKDIHSSAGIQKSPDGSSLWPLPCSGVQHGSQGGTHDGLCLCNTRLNRAKEEGTLCHLFQRAVGMVWLVELRVTPSPLGRSVSSTLLSCVLVLCPPAPHGGNMCSGFRAYKVD